MPVREDEPVTFKLFPTLVFCVDHKFVDVAADAVRLVIVPLGVQIPVVYEPVAPVDVPVKVEFPPTIRLFTALTFCVVHKFVKVDVDVVKLVIVPLGVQNPVVNEPELPVVVPVKVELPPTIRLFPALTF